MQRYEYQVIPAPKRGKKAKGVKGSEARFAHALAEAMNDMAAEGWEYLRTDTLPAEERTGLTGRNTVFQNMLVFRRPFEAVEEEAQASESGLRITIDESAQSYAPKLPSANSANTVADNTDSGLLKLGEAESAGKPVRAAE